MQCGEYHDIGKLPYLDGIGTTFRPLFKEKLDIIRLHSEAGYYLLKDYPSTAVYADVAYGITNGLMIQSDILARDDVQQKLQTVLTKGREEAYLQAYKVVEK